MHRVNIALVALHILLGVADVFGLELGSLSERTGPLTMIVPVITFNQSVLDDADELLCQRLESRYWEYLENLLREQRPQSKFL